MSARGALGDLPKTIPVLFPPQPHHNSLFLKFFFKFLSPKRSTQIKTYSWDNAQVLLVGNKCDMEDERVVSSEKGRQLAEHLGEPGGVAAVFPQII